MTARPGDGPWAPYVPGPLPSGPHPERVHNHPDLGFLHAHWLLPVPGTQGRGWRRLVARLAMAVLGPYFAAESELIGAMVRVDDALAARCDELAAEIDVLRRELDRRQVERAANEAQLAQVIDRLRSPGNGAAPA